ncbi:hypothetical protein M0R45_034777 [Rubus argutus]|uniref:Phytocyanin domain-containing protein n=1 Tax=Rubus argutus TaxID=59490 RepID=A0AAW1VVI2_RUBAR
MALRTSILVFFVAMAFLGTCSCASTSGAVYRAGVLYHVGDSGGWSIIADYNNWTSKKDFHVGDILIFGKMFHTVTQVNGEDYQSCNTKSPIKVYATGSDAITLTKPGNYYFIGGRNFKKPGHCQAGEKIHIKVTLPIPKHHLVASSRLAPSPK